MKLDVLSVRRTLRACEQGLPIPEALALIEWILDDLDAEEALESLDALMQSALRRDTESLEKLRSQIRLDPHEEEMVYGQRSQCG